ncbi:DUF4157 domain-containing protein [Aphanizomenon flos-aquae FACHB-1416]|uniref:eCIS core domain-containing protein n=1 Tax=Aphanizomenon flos-aquae TaxID=1176 RepID=UPI0016865101|nr:DUF4157 domain-containing protein [Aphanizomenon flos-aquae]MBD2672417.1 DUF4157 domain-containing protein [Aphanizomenon flos-aquae FACHB-1416]
MNTRQHIQKKHPSQSTYTPVQNLYQTRAFDIQQQPSHSSSGQENVDLDADHEQSQYKLYNLPYIPVNAPGTEPPPPIQTQLNSGEPTNYYQQGSADVPWYNRPTYPNIPVNAPGTEPPPPIQTKLTIGQPGDKYEQEADQVASQVVQQINSPVPVQSAQGQTVQREDAPPEEEEQLQAKSISDTIQREELPEEEQLQGKSLKGEIAATPNLETSIQGARGSGQPLDENIRQPMEKAFGGVDFSQVKVHNDAVSDQLNQSIQARAFTTGQDLFFRGGEYNPSSRGGQELIAHELTHVVQQGGASQIQRQLTDDLTPGQIEKMEEKGGALIQPKFHSISQTQTSTIQRAYTARRPLAGFIRGIGRMSRGGVIPNRGIFHEHIFFQDGGNPANIGFMDRNGLGQDNAGNYTIGHGRNNLDDPIMRQAVNDLGNPGQYSLLRNNCQMYVSNVYARYLELGGRAGT